MHLGKETLIQHLSVQQSCNMAGIIVVLFIINHSHYWEQSKMPAKTHCVFDYKGKKYKKEKSSYLTAFWNATHLKYIELSTV